MSAPETLDLSTATVRRQMEATADAPQDGLVPREVRFPVQYTDPETGKVYEALITCRVPEGNARKLRDRLPVALAGGVPLDAFPAQRQNAYWARAAAQYHLVDPPEWLVRWLEEDDGLALAVGARLAEHEQRFFRGDVGPGLPGARVCVVGDLVAAPPAAAAAAR